MLLAFLSSSTVPFIHSLGNLSLSGKPPHQTKSHPYMHAEAPKQHIAHVRDKIKEEEKS